jgi:hypothetical protein
MDDRTAKMIQIAIMFSNRRGDNIQVLDFRSSSGVHQLGAVQRFGDIFDWIVVETQQLVQAAVRIPVSNLLFTSTLGKALRLLGGVKWTPKVGQRGTDLLNKKGTVTHVQETTSA